MLGLKQYIKKNQSIYSILIKILDWKENLLRPIRLKRLGVDASFPTKTMLAEEPVFGDKRLIISLTTFPARIPYVGKAIRSIMHQSIKPNIIILWLSKKQFPGLERDLSRELTKLTNYGLTIKWLEDDIRSYKKLVPALLEYPEDVIVTTDDDVYFPSWWLQRLVDSYIQYPESIHAHSSTKVELLDNRLTFTTRYGIPGDGSIVNNNKLTGVGGVLYPPHILYKDITNCQKFMQLAPTNDDIWFWAMALANDKKVRWIKDNMHTLIFVEGSQENSDCLCNVNDSGERLIEKQTQAVFEAYGLFDKLK